MKEIDNYWPALEWICEECGKNNYSSLVRPSVTEEENEILKKKFGVEDDHDCEGEWLIAPNTVKCQYCNEEFNLRADNIEEDDE